MISELWGAPGGKVYYRLRGQEDFSKFPEGLPLTTLPEGSVCLIRDDDWTGNFIGPSA